jgi:hypothetical protein
MWMHADFVKKYPKCVKLLQTLPVKLKKTKILEAFLKACTENAPNAAQAKRIAQDMALKWGAKPQVIVHPGELTVPTGGGQIGNACGYTSDFDAAFNPKAPSKILITSFWFDAVELGLVDQAKNENRLTTTFLHEAVHWVRQEAGAPDEIDISFKEPPKEAGHFFEELAFGSSSKNCSEDAIWDAILSRRL